MQVTSTFVQIEEMNWFYLDDTENVVVVVEMRERVGMVNSQIEEEKPTLQIQSMYTQLTSHNVTDARN
jgi:hypothetical protein